MINPLAAKLIQLYPTSKPATYLQGSIT